MKWGTRDGRTLNHFDMDTNHIKNCINMLKKSLNTRPIMTYAGEIVVAESWVDQENKYNEDMASSIEKIIGIFEGELRLREKGKPIGQEFPTDDIKSWEIGNIYK